MKSRAAVAFAAGQPLQIVEIDVAPPKKGEVLIRMAASGERKTLPFVRKSTRGTPIARGGRLSGPISPSPESSTTRAGPR